METLEVCVVKFFNYVEDPDYQVLEIKKSINNLIILDPGLFHVATCRSDISKIDGKNGKLYYRGTPIDTIIRNNDFIDVAYHLIGVNKNDEKDKIAFREGVSRYFFLSLELKCILDAIPNDIHPMNFLSIGISALSSIGSQYIRKNDLLEKSKFIISQIAVIAAYYYIKLKNREWSHEESEKQISYKMLYQMFNGERNYALEEISKIFDKILILHAEHGQNCSTATVRSIASSGGDIYSAISGGILAFKGELHGGASQKVAEMYEDLLNNKSDINEYVDKKLNKKERLMGFGHRVYTCWDPRAKIMVDMLSTKEFDYPKVNEYKNLALDLIERVTNDDYFIKRNIYPNPDLLNCIFYKLIGVPSSMNTVMLSVSRVAGWVAHYLEYLNDKLPIIRPRQLQKLNVTE